MSTTFHIDHMTSEPQLRAIASYVLSLLGTTSVTVPRLAPEPQPTTPGERVAVAPPTASEAATLAEIAGDGSISYGDFEAGMSTVEPQSELPTIPTPPPGVDLDSAGMPWDLRIHAATKTKNTDLTWRYKRGTDKALIAAVEAELKQVMAAPVPPVPAPPAELDPAAAFGETSVTVPPPPQVLTIPPPPVPAAPIADVPPVADGLGEFARVMRVVTAKQAAGTVTTALVNEISVQLGLTSVRDLVKRPDLIPAFEALLP